jgi:hypothetical protein
MKKSLDEHLHEAMNKEQEIPEVVQTAFQNSYSMIRVKAKKKNGKRWMKPVSVAAACALVLAPVSFFRMIRHLRNFKHFSDLKMSELSSRRIMGIHSTAEQHKKIKMLRLHWKTHLPMLTVWACNSVLYRLN